MLPSLQFAVQVCVVTRHMARLDNALAASAVFTLDLAASALSLHPTQQMTPTFYFCNTSHSCAPNVCSCTLYVQVYLLKMTFDAQD